MFQETKKALYKTKKTLYKDYGGFLVLCGVSAGDYAVLLVFCRIVTGD
jgi:hypothetical protein